jgi:hypothetical protein
LFLNACNKAPPVSVPVAVRALPADLFVGDVKSLEPHLGLTSGCVEIDFRSELWIDVDVTLWRDGKPVKSIGSMGNATEGPAKVSISLSADQNEEGKPRHRLVTASSSKSGSSSANQLVEIPDLRGPGVKVPAKLQKPIELQENATVPVWALLGYENHEQASGKDLTPAEGLKQAKWAVVLGVSWKKPKD